MNETMNEPQEAVAIPDSCSNSDGGTPSASAEDLESVVDGSETILEKAEKRGLAAHLGDVTLMLQMLKDLKSGEYKGVPAFTMAAVVGALLYVLLTPDLVPDFLPGVGVIDDAAVLAACIALVQCDLVSYAESRKRKGGHADPKQGEEPSKDRIPGQV
jgi:uncharacterized membrane protein YkvA (DUF1232 family)